MNQPSREDWEAAAIRLYDDEYAFVATGPRGPERDWRECARAIMAREVADPRGWVTLDTKEENTCGPTFPFRPFTAEKVGEILNPITVDAATDLLVLLVDEWFEAKNIPDFAKRKPEMLADARTLLSRYGSGCRCFTNVAGAQATNSPDFSRKAEGGVVSMTTLTMDAGLVVTSDTEVGVFWRFNAY